MPDATAYIRRYREETGRAKAQLRCAGDLAYGLHADERLDVYLPPRDGAPVHVFIHGGAWALLSKDDSGFAAPAFVAAGFAFVALNFSLVPAASLDEMVRQVRAAIAWLWRNVERHGGDPERIFVSGHSSGAHLLSQGLVADWPGEHDCPADVIKGAAFASGLGDLEPVRLSYRNARLGLDPDAVERLSPVRREPAVRCPLVAAYAELDTDEFRRQTIEVAQYWAASGLPTELVELTGRNHFDGAFAFAEPEHELFQRCVAQARGGEAAHE